MCSRCRREAAIVASSVQSPIKGNFVKENHGTAIMTYINRPPESDPGASAEELTILEEDNRISEAWDELIDQEEARGLNSLSWKEEVLELIGPLVRSTLIPSRNNDEIDGILTALRWLPDFEGKLQKFLTNKEAVLEGGAHGKRLSRRCTEMNEPYFRLSLKDVSQKIDTLPKETLVLLRDLKVLTRSEFNEILHGDVRLSASLITKHEPEYRILRCLLRYRHRDVFNALLAAYLRSDAKENRLYPHLPSLPVHFVSRPSYETELRDWLSDCSLHDHERDIHLLLLCGLSSVGKSCLSYVAGRLAVTFGFHKVLWVSAHHGKEAEVLKDLATQLGVESSNRSEAVIMKAITEEVSAVTERGDRILLIIDDVTNDNIWQYIESFRYVLVTSRNEGIGDHSKAVKRKLEIRNGLTRDETRRMLENVMGEENFRHLEDRNLVDMLLNICNENYNMPLTVNIIGSKLKYKKEKWLALGSEYLEALRKELLDARDAWRASESRLDSRQHTGDTYVYDTVHAAIRSSIDDLSDKDQEKYSCLVVYERGDPILAVSVVVMWSGRDEEQVEDRLDQFVDHSILQRLRFDGRSKRYVFSLHDLQWNVLQAIPESKKQKIKGVVFRCYQNSRVKEADYFFYCRYISLCLSVQQIDTARNYLSKFSYLLKRIENDFSDGLLEDYSKAIEAGEGEAPARLIVYRDLVKETLPAAVAMHDAAVPLRAALYRPHQGIEFSDALKELARQGPSPRFYQYCSSPQTNTQASPPHFRMMVDERYLHKRDSITSLDIAHDDNGVLIGCRNGKVLHYEIQSCKVTACEGNHQFNRPRVVLVRFLPASSSASLCLVVTTTDAAIVDLHPTDPTITSALTKEFRARSCQSEVGDVQFRIEFKGKCLDAGLEVDHLWVLISEHSTNTDDNLFIRCYRLRPASFDFNFHREFPCIEGHSFNQIHVSHCGRTVVLGSTELSVTPPVYYVLSVGDQSMKLVPRASKVLGVFDHRRLLIEDHRHYDLRIVDVSEPPGADFGVIARFQTPADSFQVCMVDDEAYALVYRDSGKFLWRSIDASQELLWEKLMKWPKKVEETFFRRPYLFVRSSSDTTICAYLIRRPSVSVQQPGSSITTRPVMREKCQRRILAVHWLPNVTDYLMVAVEDRRLQFRLLRRNEDLMADNFIATAVSVSSRQVVAVTKTKVREWTIDLCRSTAGGDRVSLNLVKTTDLNRRVIALCHSNRDELLFVATLEQEGRCAVHRMAPDTGLTPMFAITCAGKRWRPTTDSYHFQAFDVSQTVLCCGTRDCRGRTLSVWSVSGGMEPIVKEEGIFDFNVEAERLVLCNQKGLKVWDLVSGRLLLSDGHRIPRCVHFEAGGRQLLYVTSVIDVAVKMWRTKVEIQRENEEGEREISLLWQGNVTGDIRILSVRDKCVLLMESDRIRFIDLRLKTSKIMMWDQWLDGAWSTKDCWVSPDWKFITVSDRKSNVDVLQKVEF